MQPLRRSTSAALVSLALLLAACGGPKVDEDALLGTYMESASRYFQMGQYERCVHQANKGLELDPQNERFKLIKGRSLLLVRDNNTAALEEAYRVLAQIEGLDDWRVDVSLGEVQERRGVVRLDGATEIEAGERYTDAADPLARAAELRAEARELWSKALGHYDEALQKVAGNSEALNGKMRAATLLGEETLALESGRQLIQSLTESNQLLQRDIEAKRNEASDPVRERRGLEANEEVILTTHVHLAELHRKAGRTAAALLELEAAREVNGLRPEIHGRIGQLLLELGDASGAKSSLETFFALSDLAFDDPDMLKARQTMRACDELLQEQARQGG
jgi:tetratricopeptide (TPR) repeat protein